MSAELPNVLERLQALLASRYIGDAGSTVLPAVTNYITNPKAAVNTNDWSIQGGGAETLIRSSAPLPAGTSFGFIFDGRNSSGNTRWHFTAGIPVAVGDVVRFGAWVAQTNGVVGARRLRLANSGFTTIASSPDSNAAQNVFEWLEVEYTATAAGTLNVYFHSSTVGQNVAWTGAILTKNDVRLGTITPDEYFDGSSAEASWSGTPNASTSVLASKVIGTAGSDQILDAILGGIADGAERLGIVAFGDDGILPGRALSDPSVAPDWALAHAALYTSGGLLPGRLPTEDDATYLARARDAAVYPLGIKAGTNEAIVRTVQPLLTGTKTVIISVGADPYTVVVRTLPAETPSQSAVAAAITGSFVSGGVRGALRAEMALDYTVSNSPQFSEATRIFSAVAGTVTANNVTRTDVT